MLAVAIAKSGISVLPLIPSDEILVAECSRGTDPAVRFWGTPSSPRYEEIVLLERRASTGLTQRLVAQAFQKFGVSGKICYAAYDPETLLAFRHQHYLVTSEGLQQRPKEPLPSLKHQYLVALSGFPATGKTLIRHVLARLSQFSVYKWGTYAQQTIRQALYGFPTAPITFHDVLRFAHTYETRDPLLIAKTFLSQETVRRDPAPFLVLDGIKTREQLLYVSYMLQRPIILVSVSRDEQERQQAARERGDEDDAFDDRRREFFEGLGLFSFMRMADFCIQTTGCSTVYALAERTCDIRFSRLFLEGIHQLLQWLFVSSSFEETMELLSGAAQAVAAERHYRARVEVVP